ncbi:ABC transporter permease [Thermopolyspora sp. NPDC052614]|uniref:ABC transporter permease n=1 Tax=Thermopolyspora sp. NPDC052614 TaxID=3155682 RepID=UPI00341D5974
MIGLLRRVAVTLALPVLLIAAWWWLSEGSTNTFLPPLRRILAAFADVWTLERIAVDVLPSLVRLAVGYLLAAVVAIGAGVLIGRSRLVRGIAEPGLEFARAIPPPVLVPILMLFAGIGDTMKIIVIAFGAFWPILLNTVEGVRAVDPVLLDTARSYRFGGFGRLRNLILPAAGPQIVTGLRQALSIAIILMVISEMFAAREGLGFAIIQFQRTFAIPEMWSGTILLGLLGFALAKLFQIIERRVLFWYFGMRAAARDT